MKKEIVKTRPVSKFTDYEIEFCRTLADNLGKAFGVTSIDMARRCRLRHLILARAAYFHILHQRTNFSFPKIGQALRPTHESSDLRYYSKEDYAEYSILVHSAVINAIKSVYKLTEICSISPKYKEGHKRLALINELLDNTAMLEPPKRTIHIGMRCRALSMDGVITRIYPDEKLRVLFNNDFEQELLPESVDILAHTC